jgi:hypothetical protein
MHTKMKAFETQNGNYLVNNDSEEFAFFSKDGVFLRYSDYSEYEFAKTWGKEEINVKFKFPDGEFNSPFSKEFFIKEFLKLNNVSIDKINYLQFVDSFDFEIPKWIKNIEEGIIQNCNWYEPRGNNMYDRGSYSYFQLEKFSVDKEIYTVLSTYDENWDWGDDPSISAGSYTIIKGDFISQHEDLIEKTNSYINHKGLEILSSI